VCISFILLAFGILHPGDGDALVGKVEVVEREVPDGRGAGGVDSGQGNDQPVVLGWRLVVQRQAPASGAPWRASSLRSYHIESLRMTRIPNPARGQNVIRAWQSFSLRLEVLAIAY
jgi:hypothetical protein